MYMKKRQKGYPLVHLIRTPFPLFVCLFSLLCDVSGVKKRGVAAVPALMRPSLRSFCRTRLACYSAQLDRGTRTLTFFFLPCAKKKKKGVFTLMLEWKRRSLECVWDEWKKRDPKERHSGDMEIHKWWLVPVSFLGPDFFSWLCSIAGLRHRH